MRGLVCEAVHEGKLLGVRLKLFAENLFRHGDGQRGDLRTEFAQGGFLLGRYLLAGLLQDLGGFGRGLFFGTVQYFLARAGGLGEYLSIPSCMADSCE